MSNNENTRHSRRDFLKLSALVGAGLATSLAITQKDRFEALSIDRADKKVTHTRLALGTTVSITAIHPSQTQAEDAIAAAFNDLEAMAKIFTRFGNNSPLCELNQTQKLEYVPQPMRELLAKCEHFHRDTNLAFDLSVKPLIDLFENSFAAGTQPKQSQIEQTLPLIGQEKLRSVGKGLILPQQGMGLSFDGVAPGFIADRGAEVLERYSISRYLINAGGEIRVSGLAPNREDWRILIQDPKKEKDYPGVIRLSKGAVSTSGNYEIAYTSDGQFHHLVNAKTGHSPQLSSSVTVIAPTATEADILSTAVFVMEPQEGLRYINARPQYACLIIDKDQKQYASNNFVMDKWA